jgi:C-terminal processing protease CtpA/Prc
VDSPRVCAKRDTYADGRDFVGVGVRPDVPVEVTADDVRVGRDPVEARAEAVLRERLTPTSPRPGAPPH